MSEMENRDWINDYESLKQVSPGNPFTVPSGYFNDLESRILSFQKLQALNNGNSSGGFTVPQNYFEELEAHTQGVFNISSEIGTEESFPIPDTYFDDLEQQIMFRIAVNEAIAPDGEGFLVPDGYFSDLEQQITSRIAVEEILAADEEPFTVPAGYFDNLTAAIFDKTANIKDNNRSAVIRKLTASNAFKYATAACLAMVIGGSIILSEFSPSFSAHNGSLLHKQLLNVPTDEIKSYLQLNVDAGDTQQTVINEDAPVDADKLKDALQKDIDSIR